MGKLPTLKEGTLYRILYKSQSGNYRWYKYEMWAKYVGTGRDESQLYFSLRPEAGTQDIDRDRILEIYPMPHTSQPKMPYRIGPIEPE